MTTNCAIESTTNRAKRLEIGSGGQDLGDEWVTVDCVPNRYVDHVVCWGAEPLPFEDSTFVAVRASHVLEHIPWHQTVTALREVYRVLISGGVVEIHVPDFDLLIRATLEQRCLDDHAEEGYNRELHWMHWVAERLFHFGPEEQWHRACFNFVHLRWCLEQAGFVEANRIPQAPDNAHGIIDLEVRARKIDTRPTIGANQTFEPCIHRRCMQVEGLTTAYCPHPEVHTPNNIVTPPICARCEHRVASDGLQDRPTPKALCSSAQGCLRSKLPWEPEPPSSSVEECITGTR